jgi:hypothetical protein
MSNASVIAIRSQQSSWLTGTDPNPAVAIAPCVSSSRPRNAPRYASVRGPFRFLRPNVSIMEASSLRARLSAVGGKHAIVSRQGRQGRKRHRSSTCEASAVATSRAGSFGGEFLYFVGAQSCGGEIAGERFSSCTTESNALYRVFFFAGLYSECSSPTNSQ